MTTDIKYCQCGSIKISVIFLFLSLQGFGFPFFLEASVVGFSAVEQITKNIVV